MVGLVSLEEQQRRRPVRLGAELGEEQGITSGHYAVGHEEAGVAVIRVEPVALPGVVPEHDDRADTADPRRHLETLPQSRLELPVRPAEEDDLTPAAECAGGRALLFPPESHQLGRVLCGIPRALRAVGADEVVDLAPAGCPLRERPTAAELDVVGMGADGERHSGRRQVRSDRHVAER